jgi:cytochrome bd ubiquinol oxidase subunit II
MMETVWFVILSAMLAIYVVLDGFDFGVGVLHRVVARTEAERQTVLATIEPVWDGNEVWLIAAGAVLFLAFPSAYAAAFSGFYLALMIVLWLLILRGVAIAFRSHQDDPLWREFWDAVFSFASAMLALVLGTAIGNVVRGVPLDGDGVFYLPLFTNLRTGPRPGVFDWYTTIVGALALCLLTAHGAFYLVWKTSGAVQQRSRIWARRAWLTAIPLWVAATLGTAWVQPEVIGNLLHRPWALVFLAMMIGGSVGGFYFLKRGRELAAFLSSCGVLLGLLGAAMAGNYPYWLRSTLDPAHGLTAANTAAGGPRLVDARRRARRGLLLHGLPILPGQGLSRGTRAQRLSGRGIEHLSLSRPLWLAIGSINRGPPSGRVPAGPSQWTPSFQITVHRCATTHEPAENRRHVPNPHRGTRPDDRHRAEPLDRPAVCPGAGRAGNRGQTAEGVVPRRPRPP